MASWADDGVMEWMAVVMGKISHRENRAETTEKNILIQHTPNGASPD